MGGAPRRDHNHLRTGTRKNVTATREVAGLFVEEIKIIFLDKAETKRVRYSEHGTRRTSRK